MVCGVYKIENKINGKIYIGQSVDIFSRWQHHKQMNNDCVISKALKKYGVENFDFSIIEECERKELNDREIYWIAYYDSYNNGYNSTIGGSHSVPSKLTLSDVEQIDILLQTTQLTNMEISIKFNVSENTICAINTGKSWYRDNVEYPIRKEKIIKSKKQNKVEPTINKKKNTKLSKIEVSKEELFQVLIKQKGNFTQVGKIFNVSDNAVRKWCKKYDLPFHSSDYKDIKPIKNPIPCHKSVALINKNGEIIKSFYSCAEAARWLKAEDSSILSDEHCVSTAIGRVCNGKRKTAYKKYWKFI